MQNPGYATVSGQVTTDRAVKKNKSCIYQLTCHRMYDCGGILSQDCEFRLTADSTFKSTLEVAKTLTVSLQLHIHHLKSDGRLFLTPTSRKSRQVYA